MRVGTARVPNLANPWLCCLWLGNARLCREVSSVET